jgi:hypothetical protein
MLHHSNSAISAPEGTMKKQLNLAKQQFQAVAGQSVTVARGALVKGADLLAGTASSTRKAVETVIQANTYALAKAKDLVEAELDTLAVATALGAKRLKAAGEAADLDALVKGQIALLPESRDAALAEAKKYLEMYFAAKAEIDAVVQKNVIALVTPKAKAVKKPASAKAAA